MKNITFPLKILFCIGVLYVIAFLLEVFLFSDCRAKQMQKGRKETSIGQMKQLIRPIAESGMFFQNLYSYYLYCDDFPKDYNLFISPVATGNGVNEDSLKIIESIKKRYGHDKILDEKEFNMIIGYGFKYEKNQFEIWDKSCPTLRLNSPEKKLKSMTAKIIYKRKN